MGITLNQLTNVTQKLVNKIKDKYVTKEEGKGLSSNDYSTEEKEKVAKIDTMNLQINKLIENEEYFSNIGFNFLQQGGKTEDDFDNTPILQKLITTINTMGGGNIYLPSGTYFFKRDPNRNYGIWWKDNVNLCGAGIGKTILKFGESDDSKLYPFLYYKNFNIPLKNCKFTNLTIDLNDMGNSETKYTSDGKAIFFQNIENCLFEDLELLNTPSTALGIDFINNTWINRVYCLNCGRLWEEEWKTGQGSIIEGPGGASIGIGTGLKDKETSFVTNCVCINSGHYGIFYENQATFTPNLFKKVAKNVIIANNQILYGRGYGIGLRGAEDYDIHDNIITECNWDGINLNSAEANTNLEQMKLKNIIVNNNSIKKCRDGIALDSRTYADSVFITNNKCINNNRIGISLFSGDETKNTKSNITIENNIVAYNKYDIYYKETLTNSIYINKNTLRKNDFNCGKILTGIYTFGKVGKQFFDNSITKFRIKLRLPETLTLPKTLISNKDENYKETNLVKGFSIVINTDSQLVLICNMNNGEAEKKMKSNETLPLNQRFYLEYLHESNTNTFNFKYYLENDTEGTLITFDNDYQEEFLEALANQVNDEITLFRDYQGSDGYTWYASDCGIFRIYANSKIDGYIFYIFNNLNSKIVEDANGSSLNIKLKREYKTYLDELEEG